MRTATIEPLEHRTLLTSVVSTVEVGGETSYAASLPQTAVNNSGTITADLSASATVQGTRDGGTVQTTFTYTWTIAVGNFSPIVFSRSETFVHTDEFDGIATSYRFDSSVADTRTLQLTPEQLAALTGNGSLPIVITQDIAQVDQLTNAGLQTWTSRTTESGVFSTVKIERDTTVAQAEPTAVVKLNHGQAKKLARR
jgi:hypothetical protein